MSVKPLGDSTPLNTLTPEDMDKFMPQFTGDYLGKVAERVRAERAKSVINSYRDLAIWQRSMMLAEMSYRLSVRLPSEEKYGLVTQIRRAAVSIPANIAEGHGRESTGSFIQFLRISQGSLKELETHLLLTERLGLAANEQLQPLLAECDEIGRMLRALIRSLQDRANAK